MVLWNLLTTVHENLAIFAFHNVYWVNISFHVYPLCLFLFNTVYAIYAPAGISLFCQNILPFLCFLLDLFVLSSACSFPFVLTSCCSTSYRKFRREFHYNTLTVCSAKSIDTSPPFASLPYGTPTIIVRFLISHQTSKGRTRPGAIWNSIDSFLQHGRAGGREVESALIRFCAGEKWTLLAAKRIARRSRKCTEQFDDVLKEKLFPRWFRIYSLYSMVILRFILYTYLSLLYAKERIFRRGETQLSL